ncbi:MAG: glycogen/starch synthase, partial [Chloroflexi bacterium]|nr:glycogen/starch synthase [Chloroflexota bacterium]
MAAEVSPFAKVGGLADVAASLPKALTKRGHDVRVIMPKYKLINDHNYNLVTLLDHVSIPFNGRDETASLKTTMMATEVPIYFIQCPKYFDRREVYINPENPETFAFFGRAALAVPKALAWQPDIIHCNDWHTALAPYWLKSLYYEDDLFYKNTASVLTIHNLSYQGIFEQKFATAIGLADRFLHAAIPERNGAFDFLTQGILYA